MATFARDTFSGTDGESLNNRSADLGGAWATPIGGNSAGLTLRGGRVNLEAVGGRTAVVGEPATPNYRVVADLQVLSIVAGDAAGVRGRAPDNSNYYSARFSGGVWYLQKSTTAGGLVTLGTFSEALVAGDNRVVTLDMQGSRIRVLVGGVERISVTDTSHTAKGRPGLWLTTSTAQTATTGLHVESFLASELDRRHTAATRFGISGPTFGETYVAGAPRVREPERRAVLCLRGASNTAIQSFEDVRRLAEHGYPAIAGDFGWTTSGNGSLWGNSTMVARMKAAWDWMIANYGARQDQVLIAGYSAGFVAAYNFARTYPGKVAAMAANVPGVNLRDLHDRNVLGLAANMEAAYGGTLTSFNDAMPVSNPAENLSELEGIPIKAWYSTNDTICLPADTLALDAGVVSASVESVGARGHTGGPFGVEDHAEFLADYA